MNTSASPRYRPMRFGVTEVDVRHAPGGVQYVRGVGELAPPPDRMTDRLLHWASVAPERSLFARREAAAGGSAGAGSTSATPRRWTGLVALARLCSSAAGGPSGRW